jgi:glyoxylase-like metal-dependent hydrolase (beta-lactamase superfamily II)
MPGEPMRVGPIELVPLLDGDETLTDPLEDAFPGVPAGAWEQVKRDHPDLVGAGGAWRIRIRCTLVRTPDRTILVDTGVGPDTAPAAAWFPTPGRLPAELAGAGASPTDVDTVVLTHIHDDHLGGTAESGEPTFPNARYVLQGADLRTLRSNAETDDEDREIYEASVLPLEAAGVLDVVEGDVELVPGVRLRHAPGHTPGHQVVDVAAGGARALISADAFNLPPQMTEPGWYSATDQDPQVANATRRSLLAELGGTQALVAPSHLAEPFGRIAAGPGGRTAWEPLSP